MITGHINRKPCCYAKRRKGEILLLWVGKIKEAINFIEYNIFEPINAEVVSKAINYAPSSLSNIFSALSDIPWVNTFVLDVCP